MEKEEIMKKSFWSKRDLLFLLTGTTNTGKDTIRKSELDRIFKAIKKADTERLAVEGKEFPYKDKVTRKTAQNYLKAYL